MHKSIATAVAVIALSAAGAAAADTVYTSRAAFDAATSGQSTAAFDGVAAADSFVAYGAGPYVESGMTFTGNGDMFVIDPGYYGSSYAGGGFLTSDYAQPNVVTINFAASNAFALDFGPLLDGLTQFTLAFSNGSTVFTQLAVGGIVGTNSLEFYGIVTDTAFTSVSITMNDAPYYNALDNVTIGVGAVPEPATWALMIGGFGLAGSALRRRRALPA